MVVVMMSRSFVAVPSCEEGVRVIRLLEELASDKLISGPKICMWDGVSLTSTSNYCI